jgi:uncharacterized protein (TIGR03435 family)
MRWQILLLPFLAAQQPSFEVASVKPSSEVGSKISIGRDPGGGFTARNIQLENLILLAYHVQRYQLKGEPGWVRSERFDVVAKAPAGVPRDQTWEMMKTLLADRFRLVVHRDTVEMPVYRLVPAKGGLKIRPADRPRVDPDGYFQTGRGRIRLRMAGLDQLAFALSDVLERCVQDRSGSKDNFDLQLEWTPESPEGPNIMAALAEQLGLKLEAARAPVEMVVIDRAERPSGN